MNYKFNFLVICLLIMTVVSCNNDDNAIPVVPENDRTEQQVKDNDTLVNYLNTHYYNSAEVNALENPTIDDLVITPLEEGETVPTGSTLLMSEVELKETTYLEVEYEYYILEIKKGIGTKSPTFSDNVRVNYTGFLMDGTEFDNASTPVVFDLVYVIPGWNRVMPYFNVASSFTTNSDGTVSFDGYGMGVMFLPSGLGYYARSVSQIPSYSNLIFKFELLQTETNDHDMDNIPSYMEDIKDNADLFSSDTDGNTFPNFLDQDDDGDGTLTTDEIRKEVFTETDELVLQNVLNDLDLDSTQFISPIKYDSDRGTYSANRISLVDTNGNGFFNYLDPTESAVIETE